MKHSIQILFFVIFLFPCVNGYSQVDFLAINPDNARKFDPYVATLHGGLDGLAEFKKNNRLQYAKELWYYSESFYVKRNHLAEGVTLDESIIDISRLEASRKDNDEAIVILPGFKDAIVLLPKNKLIYSPQPR